MSQVVPGIDDEQEVSSDFSDCPDDERELVAWADKLELYRRRTLPQAIAEKHTAVREALWLLVITLWAWVWMVVVWSLHCFYHVSTQLVDPKPRLPEGLFRHAIDRERERLRSCHTRTDVAPWGRGTVHAPAPD